MLGLSCSPETVPRPSHPLTHPHPHPHPHPQPYLLLLPLPPTHTHKPTHKLTPKLLSFRSNSYSRSRSRSHSHSRSRSRSHPPTASAPHISCAVCLGLPGGRQECEREKPRGKQRAAPGAEQLGDQIVKGKARRQRAVVEGASMTLELKLGVTLDSMEPGKVSEMCLGCCNLLRSCPAHGVRG